MNKVSISEQETTINFYRDSVIAEVYTSDRTVMTKLDKRCKQYPAVYRLVKQGECGKWYEFDKSRIGFKAPPHELSERQLENLRQLHDRVAKNETEANNGGSL